MRLFCQAIGLSLFGLCLCAVTFWFGLTANSQAMPPPEYKVDCSLEYAPYIYYQIKIDQMDKMEIVGPRMFWRGPASYYGNPQGEQWYAHFGPDYVAVRKWYPNGSVDEETIMVEFHGQNVSKQCR